MTETKQRPSSERFRRPDEVAAELGLSEWSVYRLIRRGELRPIKISGRIRIERAEIDRYVRDSQQDVA
jgi:excisionase family DNA binding protein